MNLHNTLCYIHFMVSWCSAHFGTSTTGTSEGMHSKLYKTAQSLTLMIQQEHAHNQIVSSTIVGLFVLLYKGLFIERKHTQT